MPPPFQPSRLGAVRVAAALLVTLACIPCTLRAQRLIADASVVDALPDAPLSASGLQSSPQSGQTPTSAASTTDAHPPQQTKRILGVMPNFRSVSADTKLPPQSAKDKFIAAGHDTFDYSSFLIAAVQAGFAMNGKSTPEFHQGVPGYVRYYWHTLADTVDENFMVGGVGPVLFHQDNRFYTLGHGSVGHRALYAVTRVLITRKDDGDNTFNRSPTPGDHTTPVTPSAVTLDPRAPRPGPAPRPRRSAP